MERAPRRLFREVSGALVRRAREFLHRVFPRARLSGRPGLNSPTGSLRRSFDLLHDGNTLQSFRMVEFTTSKSAPAHEHGALIRPRRRKYLAVPLAAVKTAAGDVRGGPRSYSNTFFARSKAGNLILFQKRGAGQAPTPLFAMVSQVRIPRRLGFFEEWTKNQSKRIQDMAAATSRALDSLGSA